MRYTDTYLYNHDIDWFCVVNGYYIHVASAGGVLPTQINDDEALRSIQHQVELLPEIHTNNDIFYDEVAIMNALGGGDAKGRKQYIESFTAMARKGFASFDRTNIGDLNNNQYHLVCRPRNMDVKPEGLHGIYTIVGLDVPSDYQDIDFLKIFNNNSGF